MTRTRRLSAPKPDLTCPICGKHPNEYAPWYKPSRGTLGGHLYTAHTDELVVRFDPDQIKKLHAAGFRVERGAPGRLPIKFVLMRGKR